MTEAQFTPLTGYLSYSETEMLRRAREFRENLGRRRTVRDYSDRPVPREVIEECLLVAGSAPSGANRQPWHFVVVSDPEIKSAIRGAAEIEEKEFYSKRAPPDWLEALAPLGTDFRKPFLETAPYLIAVFAETYQMRAGGTRSRNYYVSESVGIASGFLIAALHQAGLACLTHTPSPMGFLNRILRRSPNERPFLLLVVGYPAEGAVVPVIDKKSLDEITTFV